MELLSDNVTLHQSDMLHSVCVFKRRSRVSGGKAYPVTHKLRILVWSDLHAHPWQENVGDVNIKAARALWVQALLRRLQQEVRKQKADIVIFCGDMFESKRTLRSTFTGDVFAGLARLHAVVPCYYVAGNHDWATSSKTVLSGIIENARQSIPMQEGQWSTQQQAVDPAAHTRLVINGITLRLQPFTVFGKNGGDVDCNLIFCHHDIKGFSHADGVVSDATSANFPVRLLALSKSRLAIINGHYHIPTARKGTGKALPIINVGAPVSHNWGDLEKTQQEYNRGFLLLDVYEDDEQKTRSLVATRLTIGNVFPRFFVEGDSRIDNHPQYGGIAHYVRPQFVVEEETETSATDKKTTNRIAGTNNRLAVGEYLRQKRPELKGPAFSAYLKKGLQLLR